MQNGICTQRRRTRRPHKHSKSIQFVPNCPRTRASASPVMSLYGKNPNNVFLQTINVLMFDAVAMYQHPFSYFFLRTCKNCCIFASAKAYAGDSWGGNGWVQPWLLPMANGYRLCVYAVATATITPCARSLCTYIVIKRRLLALVLVYLKSGKFQPIQNKNAVNAHRCVFCTPFGCISTYRRGRYCLFL